MSIRKSITIDSQISDQLDKWIVAQTVPPKKKAVVEYALTALFEDRIVSEDKSQSLPSTGVKNEH